MPQEQNCCCPCLIHEQEYWVDPAVDLLWDYTGNWTGRTYLWEGPVQPHISSDTVIEDETVPLYEEIRLDGEGVVYLQKPNYKNTSHCFVRVKLTIYNQAGSKPCIILGYDPEEKTGLALQLRVEEREVPIASDWAYYFPGAPRFNVTALKNLIICELGWWSDGEFSPSVSIPIWNPQFNWWETLAPGVEHKTIDTQVFLGKARSFGDVIFGSSAFGSRKWITVEKSDVDIHTNNEGLGLYIALGNSGTETVSYDYLLWQLHGDTKAGCPEADVCWYCESEVTGENLTFPSTLNMHIEVSLLRIRWDYTGEITYIEYPPECPPWDVEVSNLPALENSSGWYYPFLDGYDALSWASNTPLFYAYIPGRGFQGVVSGETFSLSCAGNISGLNKFFVTFSNVVTSLSSIGYAIPAESTCQPLKLVFYVPGYPGYSCNGKSTLPDIEGDYSFTLKITVTE